MKPQVVGLRVASVVFGIMALAQLGRLAVRPEILVAGYVLPLWPSGVAVVILAGLCLWLWRLSTLPTDSKGSDRDV